MSDGNVVKRIFEATTANQAARRFFMGLSILTACVAVVVVMFLTRNQTDPIPRTEKAWPVSVIDIEPKSLSPLLTVFGKVESSQVANIKTSISARVAEVVTPEGEWVDKGDILIRLDESELELAVQIAAAENQRQQAQLESVKTDQQLADNLTRHYQELSDISQAKLQRHLDLFSRKMISDSLLDEVRQQASERYITLARHLARVKDFPNVIAGQQAGIQEAEARLKQTRLDMAQARIEAPFMGRVIKTLVAPGDRTLPGTSLIRVADYSGLEVRATLPASVAAGLRLILRQGERVTATGVLDDKEMTFHLDRLSGDVKLGQTGIDSFFQTDMNEIIDIGRVISLIVTLPAEQDVVPIPVQSLYENNRVYRVEDSRLVAIPVQQVGDYKDEYGNYRILVRSPELKYRDRLITTQLPRAITGLLVDTIDPAAFETADARR